jgi:glycosyltransferase 2 family protein
MKKKLLISLIKIIIGVALLVFIIYKIAPDWEKSKNLIVNLLSSEIGFFLLGTLCFGMVLLIGIYRWYLLLLAHKLRLSVIDVAKLLFVGHFFSQFMPGGIAGGDIVKSYYITSHTDDRKHEAVTTIFIDRIAGVLGLFGVLIIAVAVNLGSIGYSKYVIIVLAFLGCCWLSLFLFFNKNLMKKIPGMAKIISKMPYKDFIGRIYNAFHYYKDHKAVILLTFLMSVVVHLLLALMTFYIGRGLGLETPLRKYLILVSLVNFVGSIPVSPLGTVGTLDGAYIKIFESEAAKESGIPGALALMVRLVYALWGLAGLVIWLFMKSQLSVESRNTASPAGTDENLNA